MKKIVLFRGNILSRKSIIQNELDEIQEKFITRIMSVDLSMTDILIKELKSALEEVDETEKIRQSFLENRKEIFDMLPLKPRPK